MAPDINGSLKWDCSKRLGGGSRDGRDVQEHPFFFSMDFEKLLALQIPAPFIPEIKGADDTRYYPSISLDIPCIDSPHAAQ
jgi:hypothetical protein